jgi:hypothetical protein
MKIINNINYILKKEFLEMEDVVYLLNRIRILIESKNQKKKYELLNFYGNWIAHYEIEQLPNKIINEIQNMEKKHTNRIQDHWLLRSELCLLFQENNFQKDLLNDRGKWDRFSTSLYRILIDTPLVNKDNSFNFIFKDSNEKEGKSFSCSYEIQYQNSTGITNTISASYAIHESLYKKNNKKWLTQEGVCN